MTQPRFHDPSLPLEERVNDLLAQMTLEEKTDQLIQVPLGRDTNPNNMGEAQFRPTVGSLLNSMGGAKVHNAFQRAAMEESRLGIPFIFGQDIIHGCVTLYPHALGQACSFRPELVEACARLSARETVAMGYHWTFSPMIDVARDPRWGRVVEGYGEDAYVNGIFGAATVRGYQGKDLSAPQSIAACLKHFVGYGWSEGARDYAYTDISSRTLWESCLPPYKMGVEAGAATIMSSFNDISGTPAVANRYTLTEVLRNQWGFDGFVVSDWGAVNQLAFQGMTRDPKRMTKLCLEAGNDMDMADQVFLNIPQLVGSGELDLAVVDESVRRVLRVKFRLGLFETPYFDESAAETALLQPETKAAAEALAAETLVLLKNEGSLLPLRASSIALIGPTANSCTCLNGSWTGCAKAEDTITIQAGLTERFEGTITTALGCELSFDSTDESGFSEAVAAARSSDVVVLCLGEEGNWSGENQSRSSIELPPIQERLLDAIKATDKPIVLVLTHGRPLGLETVAPKVDAILAAWQPGTMGGYAITDALLGVTNPSGRLAVTFPRTTGHIPTYYCEHNRARKGNAGAYIDAPPSALYEFGHGLSYTTYEYSPLILSTSDMKASDMLTATVTVRNTGDRDGSETVLWTLRDPEAAITQPKRKLIAFEKVDLASGESKEVTLSINPMTHLSYPDNDGKRILEPGQFVLEASRRVDAEFMLVGASGSD